MNIDESIQIKPRMELESIITSHKDSIIAGCCENDPVCILIEELSCNLGNPTNRAVQALLQAALERFLNQKAKKPSNYEGKSDTRSKSIRVR